jgi:membrane-associated phospholipid phosphatase
MAMTETAANLKTDPLQKLDAAVIATRPTRRYRAVVFQAFVLGASAVFVVLAVVAHSVAYFPIDLTLTHVVQSYHGAAFDRLMYGLSWLGFLPQVVVLGAATIALLFMAGLRWEAVATVFAASSVGVGTLVKLVVYRPRPSVDLVHVFSKLPSSGFPSGHVLVFTAFGGFLGFLVYTLLKPSWGRTTLLVTFALLIVLMGLSRIYQGQHWFSDVMGAYLLGSLWLALTIKVYRWGKPRFFAHQPVAPEIPAAPIATAVPRVT